MYERSGWKSLYVASFKYANCKEKVRSAILASTHLNALSLDNLNTKDVSVAMIKIPKIGRAVTQIENVLFASLYWEILAKTIPSDLRKVHDYARDKNLKMIVMMDFNAHSTLFGSLEQNERGTIIENKAGRLASSVTVRMGG